MCQLRIVSNDFPHPQPCSIGSKSSAFDSQHAYFRVDLPNTSGLYFKANLIMPARRTSWLPLYVAPFSFTVLTASFQGVPEGDAHSSLVAKKLPRANGVNLAKSMVNLYTTTESEWDWLPSVSLNFGLCTVVQLNWSGVHSPGHQAGRHWVKPGALGCKLL